MELLDLKRKNKKKKKIQRDLVKKNNQIYLTRNTSVSNSSLAYTLRQIYKLQKEEILKRSQEKPSRYQTRSGTKAELESQREQSRPQTRSVTQSQQK